MKLAGVDVGSTTVKAVVVDSGKVTWQDYQRHNTRQAEKVAEFLQRMLDRCQADRQKEWLKTRFDNGEFNAIPASVRAPFRARLP